VKLEQAIKLEQSPNYTRPPFPTCVTSIWPLFLPHRQTTSFSNDVLISGIIFPVSGIISLIWICPIEVGIPKNASRETDDKPSGFRRTPFWDNQMCIYDIGVFYRVFSIPQIWFPQEKKGCPLHPASCHHHIPRTPATLGSSGPAPAGVLSFHSSGHQELDKWCPIVKWKWDPHPMGTKTGVLTKMAIDCKSRIFEQSHLSRMIPSS